MKMASFGDVFGKFILFFAPPVVVIVGGVITSFYNDPKHSWWVCILFALPLLIDIVGWIFIHEESENFDYSLISEKPKEAKEGAQKFCLFYSLTMIVSVIFYGFGWILYIFSASFSAENLQMLSIICLILISILFSIAAFVAYIILENSQKHKSPFMIALKDGLELFPFWRFAHFFSIFMSVSFLFGFTFAFHDLSYRKTKNDISQSKESEQQKNTSVEGKFAIYVENIASDEESANVNSTNNSIEQTIPKTEMLPSCFYFESGKSNFSANDRTEELKKASLTDRNMRISLARDDRNYKELSKLLSQIEQNKSYGIPRIILVGRADDKKIEKVYPSNYHLSEARIRRMKSVITNEFYIKTNKIWQSIDWIEIANSNELPKDISNPSNEIKSGCQSLDSDTDSERRVVEVYLIMVSLNNEMLQMRELREKQLQDFNKSKYKTPNLMDYMYFSIYTISTTGYGDIKPATKFSKFLVSLENFFEIFFLVCFMSSLIALKHEIQDCKYKGH